MRTESDRMGTIEVPDDVYWEAQTARSLIHFNFGEDRMSPELIRAIGREANQVLKFLSDEEFQKVVRPEAMTKPDEA